MVVALKIYTYIGLKLFVQNVSFITSAPVGMAGDALAVVVEEPVHRSDDQVLDAPIKARSFLAATNIFGIF
jgi:hypothetical protein